MQTIFSAHTSPIAQVGTSPALLVPGRQDAITISPGSGYLLVKIRNAQAVFKGSFWEQAKTLVVTSNVSTRNGGAADHAAFGIQRTIPIKKNASQLLGLNVDLTHLLPAKMETLSVAVEYIVDKQNCLGLVSELVNASSLLVSLSFAPGAAATAKAVGGISQKLLRTFLPQEERKPVLRFEEAFNLSAGVRSGYYVVFGSSETSQPLPHPASKLEVINETVFVNGEPAQDWSYVLLEVIGVPVRTRDLSDGALWDEKLRSVESTSLDISRNPLARKAQKDQALGFCQGLIREAHVLLLNDPNYLRSEAENIINVAYDNCFATIFKNSQTRGEAALEQVDHSALRSSRASFGLRVGDDVEQEKARYEAEARESQHILREAGLGG
jgi:hypothetical protein